MSSQISKSCQVTPQWIIKIKFCSKIGKNVVHLHIPCVPWDTEKNSFIYQLLFLHLYHTVFLYYKSSSEDQALWLDTRKSRLLEIKFSWSLINASKVLGIVFSRKVPGNEIWQRILKEVYLLIKGKLAWWDYSAVYQEPYSVPF